MNKKLPAALLADERRVATRAPVAIEADLRKPGRTSFKILVRDLSRTGCRADTLVRMVVGDKVWLTLPGFAPLQGVLRWVTPREIGIEWTTTIHASVFDHICRHYPGIV